MSQAFVGLSVTEVVASSITVVAGNRVAAACQEQQGAWHEMLLRTLFDINLNRSCAVTLTKPGICAGTTMNYFLDDRINNAAVLFPGVGCFLIAACLGSWLHASNVADIDKKLGIQRGGDVIDRYVIRSHPNWSRTLGSLACKCQQVGCCSSSNSQGATADTGATHTGVWASNPNLHVICS